MVPCEGRPDGRRLPYRPATRRGRRSAVSRCAAPAPQGSASAAGVCARLGPLVEGIGGSVEVVLQPQQHAALAVARVITAYDEQRAGQVGSQSQTDRAGQQPGDAAGATGVPTTVRSAPSLSRTTGPARRRPRRPWSPRTRPADVPGHARRQTPEPGPVSSRSGTAYTTRIACRGVQPRPRPSHLCLVSGPSSLRDDATRDQANPVTCRAVPVAEPYGPSAAEKRGGAHRFRHTGSDGEGRPVHAASVSEVATSHQLGFDADEDRRTDPCTARRIPRSTKAGNVPSTAHIRSRLQTPRQLPCAPLDGVALLVCLAVEHQPPEAVARHRHPLREDRDPRSWPRGAKDGFSSAPCISRPGPAIRGPGRHRPSAARWIFVVSPARAVRAASAHGHPASASGPGATARSAPTAHQSTAHPDQRPADPIEMP
ncbi:hypothetical protein SCHAM137S_02357 [Streptomyces chartreusis]